MKISGKLETTSSDVCLEYVKVNNVHFTIHEIKRKQKDEDVRQKKVNLLYDHK